MANRHYSFDQTGEYLLDGHTHLWVGLARSAERIHQLRRADGIVVELTDAKAGRLAREGRLRAAVGPGRQEPGWGRAA